MIEQIINYTTKVLNKIKYEKDLEMQIIENEFNYNKFTQSYTLLNDWYDADEVIKNIYKLAKEFSLKFESSNIQIKTCKKIKEKTNEMYIEGQLIIYLDEVK